MNISVLGCGRWASFHAWYANHIGHNVKIWGREGSKHLEQLQSPDITYTNDLNLADKHHVELPICAVINEIVINHKNPKEELLNLFMRPLKAE